VGLNALLVGQAPARSTDVPWLSDSGRRLARMIGLHA
jgi:uracil-DNA glycosylase